MEKELKKTVNETTMMENDSAENATTETAKKMTVVTDVLDGNLLLRREAIKDKHNKLMKSKDGRQLYSYTVNGSVRGRAVKADFVPRDIGGYEPLDIIFDFSLPVVLIVSEENSVDYSGNKISRTSYKAQAVDENGDVFSCEIKPQRLSDKSLVDMLLNAIK